VLDATWACVRGLGITKDRILAGVLDGPLNDALAVDPARGFEPTWVIWLANLIGATDVPVVIDELRAEVAALDADALRLPGATVVRDSRQLPPLRPCTQAQRTAPAADPQRTVQRLRRLPGLATLPDWRPRS
jgi:hypothetical protein